LKLTDLLLHKKFGQCQNIDIKDDYVIFYDINSILPLNNWEYADLNEFDNFISKYNFPQNKEFKKKDKEAVRESFPKPQFILKKYDNQNIRIAFALYEKKTLTGQNILHLRSINKFEQMEIKYFLNTTIAPINEPKIQKRGFYEFCQSSDIYFNYGFLDNETVHSARLRIITFRFDEYILLMYAFDRNGELEQTEIDKISESIKAAANNCFA
jgi:hypothetical protein